MGKKKKEALQWLKNAENDLEIAEILLKNEKHKAAAFHSQQASEKALKALLIQRKSQFPRIHDLVKLSRMLKAPHDIIEFCARIDPAYTSARYPDVASDFDIEEVREILDYSKKVVEWTKKALQL